MGMLIQFVLRNASGILNRSPSKVPRLVLPEEVFVNIGKAIGSEVNHGLRFLQDVACWGNIKQFLVVIASLWAVAIIGSWCNFLTVLYIDRTISTYKPRTIPLPTGRNRPDNTVGLLEPCVDSPYLDFFCPSALMNLLVFVAAHTLPILEQLQHNYRKLDAGILRRIPKGKLGRKKVE